jgi:hypothetical protein
MKNSVHEGSSGLGASWGSAYHGAQETNYRDFLSIIETLNAQLAEHIDFCILPGDNADDGTPDQYALIRTGPERLKIPIHVIPGDHDRKAGDEFIFAARVFEADAESSCRFRVNDGPWKAMHRATQPSHWKSHILAPRGQFALTVEACDSTGNTDIDTVCVATPGYRPADRTADGSDADAIDAWPERHPLGTRLGPNRNGKKC